MASLSRTIKALSVFDAFSVFLRIANYQSTSFKVQKSKHRDLFNMAATVLNKLCQIDFSLGTEKREDLQDIFSNLIVLATVCDKVGSSYLSYSLKPHKYNTRLSVEDKVFVRSLEMLLEIKNKVQSDSFRYYFRQESVKKEDLKQVKHSLEGQDIRPQIDELFLEYKETVSTSLKAKIKTLISEETPLHASFVHKVFQEQDLLIFSQVNPFTLKPVSFKAEVNSKKKSDPSVYQELKALKKTINEGLQTKTTAKAALEWLTSFLNQQEVLELDKKLNAELLDALTGLSQEKLHKLSLSEKEKLLKALKS